MQVSIWLHLCQHLLLSVLLWPSLRVLIGTSLCFWLDVEHFHVFIGHLHVFGSLDLIIITSSQLRELSSFPLQVPHQIFDVQIFSLILWIVFTFFFLSCYTPWYAGSYFPSLRSPTGDRTSSPLHWIHGVSPLDHQGNPSFHFFGGALGHTNFLILKESHLSIIFSFVAYSCGVMLGNWGPPDLSLCFLFRVF